MEILGKGTFCRKPWEPERRNLDLTKGNRKQHAKKWHDKNGFRKIIPAAVCRMVSSWERLEAGGGGEFCKNVLLIQVQCGEGAARHSAQGTGTRNSGPVLSFPICEMWGFTRGHVNWSSFWYKFSVLHDPRCPGGLDVTMDSGRREKVNSNLHV